MELFLDNQAPTFEKVAAEVQLPEDPNQWPHEILQELHKQVSYISDFDPRIVMDRVDAEKGYGFGHFEVATKMSDPNASAQDKDDAGKRTARIPIVIEEGRLKPFDLVINQESKMVPLTEERLRQVMFRPQMFDMAKKGPGDQSIVERLYPPFRGSNYGGSGSGASDAGMVVQSAAGAAKEDIEKSASAAHISQAAGRVTGRTKYLRPVPKTKPGALGKVKSFFGMSKKAMAKTAEQEFNDFVSGGQGESKSNSFEAWDGQKIETAGESDQRRRVRAEGDLEAIQGKGEGAWGQVLSDQNREAMGMPTKGPVAATSGKASYDKRQSMLHSIAGGRMKQAAMKQMKLKGPETDKIIEGQKADGKNGWYAGTMAADGSIKQATIGALGGAVGGYVGSHKDDGLGGTLIAGLPAGVLAGVGTHKALQAAGVNPVMASAAGELASLPAGMLAGKGYSMLKGRMQKGDPSNEKRASIIETILPTITDSQYEKMASQLTPDVQVAMLRNTAAAEIIGILGDWESTKSASAGDFARQDVTQIKKTGQGYEVKYASSKYWDPRTVVMDRGSAYEAIGSAVTDVDIHGCVTMVKNAAVDGDGPSADAPEPVEEFGMYKVETTEGQKIVGFAIPNLIDMDGTVLPMVLFTNGSVSAVQGDMVGIRGGGEPNLPDGPMRGHGCFVRTTQSGKAEATVPLEISTEVSVDGANSWAAETFDGDKVTIKRQPGVSMPMRTDSTVIIPDDFRWMPLGGDAVSIVDRAEAFGKVAEAKRSMLEVLVRGGGGTYSFEGMPLEKLGYDDTQFLDIDQAAFLLGGLGVAAEYAMQKLGEAHLGDRPVRVRVGRIIKTAGDRMKEAHKSAALRLAGFPRPELLLKEAAVIPDPAAVDTVLSLGFINPENIMDFVNALPRIEEAQQRMCELLLGARLGLKEVPEGSLEKGIRSTEDVLEGLKVLAFQEN